MCSTLQIYVFTIISTTTKYGGEMVLIGDHIVSKHIDSIKHYGVSVSGKVGTNITSFHIIFDKGLFTCKINIEEALP